MSAKNSTATPAVETVETPAVETPETPSATARILTATPADWKRSAGRPTLPEGVTLELVADALRESGADSVLTDWQNRSGALRSIPQTMMRDAMLKAQTDAIKSGDVAWIMEQSGALLALVNAGQGDATPADAATANAQTAGKLAGELALSFRIAAALLSSGPSNLPTAGSDRVAAYADAFKLASGETAKCDPVAIDKLIAGVFRKGTTLAAIMGTPEWGVTADKLTEVPAETTPETPAE